MIARRAPVQAADDRRERDAHALLDALAIGIRARADEQRRAEERLASFVFHEAQPAPFAPAATASASTRTTAWRYYAVRALRAIGEPGAIALLERLRDGPRSLAELADLPDGGWAGDRVATADWIGGLATAGLVSRELETGRVALAPLGRAILDLLVELDRRLEGLDAAEAPTEPAITGSGPATEPLSQPATAGGLGPDWPGR